jgi:hypothetical protein
MKILIVATCALMFCFSYSEACGQTCKPDISTQDKISKQQVEYWVQTVSTSEVAITLFIGGRSAIGTQVGMLIQKQEKAATGNANFQSALHAAKGNQFYFGLKNGEPLTFVATDVSNEAKVSGSFMAGFTGKNLVTNVQLWVVVQDNDLAKLRDVLSRRQIDAVRIVLAGDVHIEKSVSDKDGSRMMEKFGCFYQSLDKRGVDLSAVTGPPKQDEPQKTATQLTIDQVIQMVAAKLPDDVIITTIQKSNSKFELTPEALIKLKTAGVSDAVIRAMTK